MSAMFDLCILGLIAGVTYALMSEGLWGAALQFFNTLFAALIAFNFYEPLAQLIVDNAGPESFISSYADSVCMMLLFVVSLLLLRLSTDSLAPSMVRFPTPLYHLGRLVFGLGGAIIAVAMLLLGYQASPVQKKMLGVMDYKHKPIYSERFDRDFLAFFQYTTGYTFARNGVGDPDPEFPGSRPMLFDPRAEWLLVHQQARPYGTEAILEEPPATPAPAGGAAPAAGAEAGGPQPGGPGPGPGGPGGRGRRPGEPGP